MFILNKSKQMQAVHQVLTYNMPFTNRPMVIGSGSTRLKMSLVISTMTEMGFFLFEIHIILTELDPLAELLVGKLRSLQMSESPTLGQMDPLLRNVRTHKDNCVSVLHRNV